MIYNQGVANTGSEQQQTTKILARVYAEILSWPNPRKTYDEPATDDLGRETEAGSKPDVAADAATNLLTSTEQSLLSDEAGKEELV